MKAARWPGGPSATTFHRASSPNHQNDSKENHRVGPPTRRAEANSKPDGGKR